MGCILNKVESDYENYVAFCELVNEKPVLICDKFYKYQEKIMKKHGYIFDGYSYKLK